MLMPVNECSLYRQSKPFPSVLSREQEEVAFQVLNCLRTSAQSGWRNSHRILNCCYWAFPHTTGAQISFLTNAFSSQESRDCSARSQEQQLPSAEQGTAAQGTFKCSRASVEPAPSTCSADRMVPTGSSALQDEPKEKLDPEETFCTPSLFCVEGQIWASTTDLAEVSFPFVLS